MENKQVWSRNRKLKIMEELQTNAQETVAAMVSLDKNVSHQDATNVWFFGKLAEYELRLRSLENPIPTHDTI